LFSPSVKLTAEAGPGRLVTSSGRGAGSRTSLPGLALVMGRVEMASTGSGWATVPGANQETVTDRAGSLPQVSRSCSGAVVVGRGSVVVGGPEGAVAARALWRPKASVAPASPTAAPATATPPRKVRREKPGSSSAAAGPSSFMSESSMPGTVWKAGKRAVAAGRPVARQAGNSGR